MLSGTFLVVSRPLLCALEILHYSSPADESQAPLHNGLIAFVRSARGLDPDVFMNWTVELNDGDQAFDLIGARTVLEQVGQLDPSKSFVCTNRAGLGTSARQAVQQQHELPP